VSELAIHGSPTSGRCSPLRAGCVPQLRQHFSRALESASEVVRFVWWGTGSAGSVIARGMHCGFGKTVCRAPAPPAAPWRQRQAGSVQRLAQAASKSREQKPALPTIPF